MALQVAVVHPVMEPEHFSENGIRLVDDTYVLQEKKDPGVERLSFLECDSNKLGQIQKRLSD